MQPLTNVHHDTLEVPLLDLVVEPGETVMVTDEQADGFRSSPHYWHIGDDGPAKTADKGAAQPSQEVLGDGPAKTAGGVASPGAGVASPGDREASAAGAAGATP